MLPPLLPCCSLDYLGWHLLNQPFLFYIFFLFPPVSPPFPARRLQLFCGFLRFFASRLPSPILSSFPFPLSSSPFPSPLLSSLPSPFPSPFPSGVRLRVLCMYVCMYVCTYVCMYVLVVVDSHIRRIVLATEETTETQQVSHRPIKCQSRLWSQRGTKVNGSHHGDSPLLRPTGIQIATKSYAALQAMAPTNNTKTVHQTSLLHIESNLDRLGMLPPTHDLCSQQKNEKITLQPVLINKSKFLKATHCTEIRKIEIPRSMVVKALLSS